MTRRSRLALDIGLFIALLLAFFPGFTGITVHEWLSLATFVPIVVHTAINWDWVTRTTSRILQKMRATSRVNLAIDILLFVATVTVLLSGMMVSQVIAGTFGISIVPSYAWHVTHSFSATAVIVLMLVHLALHWSWIARVAKDILFAPETGGRTAVPVRISVNDPYES